MVLTYAVLAVVFLVPVFVAWLIWRLTRRIERAWLRSLVRAIALAAALTPTIAPVPSLHGALPMPAVWVLICGIFGFGSEDRMIDLRYGGIPLLVVFAAIWLISMAITFFRPNRPT
jgi:hypothetical protein